MLRIRLLGELEVQVDGEAVPALRSRRARALLGWLALNRGLHPRSELASRFWPGIPGSSARASLRNELWTLRRTLGARADDYLVATRDRVGLAEGPAIWVDAFSFSELVEEGRLEEALDLCRGELLAGLDDTWVQDAREDHRRQVARVLDRLAAAAEAEGDIGKAIAWTRRGAALDPLSEEAQRELIRRLAAAGDRAAALAAYARLRDRLRAELGVAPSPLTRQLVEELVDEDHESGDRRLDRLVRGHHSFEGQAPGPTPDSGPEPASDRALPLPPRLGRTEQAPFVGRAYELGKLYEAWKRSWSEETARLVVATGEPGIGKTRLAKEFALEAHRQGAIVLYGRAEEEALLPYQPFVEAIRHYALSSSGDELRQRLVPGAVELARVVPELTQCLPDPYEGRTGAPEVQRHRLFEAMASLLVELSRLAPLLLVLDDLHWADKPTAQLLKHLVHHRPRARLLILGTYRQAELGSGDPLAHTIADLGRDSPPERLELSALEETDVASLIASAGREPTAEFARALHAHTQGNPFFVQEVLRSLEDYEATREDDGPTERTLRHLGVPEGVREIVDQRLVRLSEPCSRLLRIAAVMGREFELLALERVTDTGAHRLLELLEEAVAAGIVAEVDGAVGAYSFSHALIREALYRGLTSAHRLYLHRRIGEALEELYSTEDSPQLLAELAHHFGAAGGAGDTEKAVDYALRAGDVAVGQLAYEQAVTLYNQALELLGEREDPRRRPLVLKRALSYQALMHMVFDTGQERESRPHMVPA